VLTYEGQEWRSGQPKIRQDALPEHMSYQDTGCEVAPSCLRCPLARCQYERGGGRRLRASERDHHLLRVYRRGASIDSLALAYGLSRRSFFRILARAGNERVV
jgi:hypothetical protein